MATSFMTNADYLDDRRIRPLIAILCNAPKALSCATNQSFEPSMRYADERPRLQKLDVQSKIVLQLFWQNEAKMVNIFKGAA